MKVKNIKVNFFNNKISIEDIPDERKMDVQPLWEELREDYADWVSEVRLKSFESNRLLVEMLEWKGMSTWWINNLVGKDSEGDTKWLHRLMVMYFCNKFQKNLSIETDDKILMLSLKKNFPMVPVTLKLSKKNLKKSFKLKLPGLLKYIRLFRSLYDNIKRLMLVSYLTYEPPNGSNVWFMTTYPANWVKSRGSWHDRHLVDSPLKDSAFKMKSGYLVYILSYSKDFSLSFFELRKKIVKLKVKAKRDVFFPESMLTFKDVIGVYSSTVMELFRFRKWKKNKNFRDLFVFSNMDLSLILMDHWENSYFGIMQYCKLHGLATMRFLELTKCKQTIVTYLEIFVETRVDYHLKKLTEKNATFYALQHSQESKNYGGAYNRKSEFSQDRSDDHIHYCPSPDYFLVHGDQYKRILSEFYPINKINIIGSLKNKQHLEGIGLNSKVNMKINSQLSHNLQASIVVAFSSNDADFLLDLLSSWRPLKSVQIWITLHPVNDEKYVIDKIKNKLSHLQTKLIMDIPTWKILPHVDAMVCGYSNLIYESLLLNIPTAVLQPLSVFSPREIDKRISKFHDIKLFDSWFNDILISDGSNHDKNYYESFFYDYYYFPDGLADERMWDFIDKHRLN